MKYQRDGFSVEAGLLKGRPAPDWYLDEPELGEHDDFFLEAFGELSTERAPGFDSLGQIPWSKIRDYANEAGLEGDVASAFRAIIREMDNAYRAEAARRSS